MDRRRFSLLALGAALTLAGCGRRGALEPPPYTAQGREWARRSGANRAAQGGSAPPQAQASVANTLAADEEQRGTVDVEGRIERAEGVPTVPSDPIQSAPPAAATPSISPTGSRRRPPGIVPPNRPFILDGLLE